jgi:diacylglycerol kinase (ATP)
MRKALLVYNPAAGRIPVRPFVPGIVRLLYENGWKVQVAETLSGHHARQVSRQAAAEEFQAVFAIGGDGTIGQVAGGLVGSQTALGVLPAGTANVWASELRLPIFTPWRWRVLRENARLLSGAPIHSVDTGLCNGQTFLLWAGIGLDAMTIHQLEPRRRLEKYLSIPHYAAAVIWNASIWHGMNLRVWADGRKVGGHFLLAVVTNIRHYLGGLATLSPEAFMDDGLMDLWLFSGSSLADALRHFLLLRSGQHLQDDQARCVTFRRLRVESDTPFPLQLDGEPLLGAQRVVFTIQRRALQVLMPPRGLELLSRAS